MAASTAGMVVLQNLATGNTRMETFTCTPAANEYVTWGSTGQTHVLTSPAGEQIVDIQFNNDGITTTTQAKILIDGTDIRNRFLTALFAADSKMPTRIVSPIKIGGNKQLQMQMLA